MNFKAGDKCVIINSKAGNNGKVVTLLYAANSKYDFHYNHFDSGLWVTDISLPYEQFGEIVGSDPIVPEYNLQKLPEKEETTTWESLAEIWNPTLEDA